MCLCPDGVCSPALVLFSKVFILGGQKVYRGTLGTLGSVHVRVMDHGKEQIIKASMVQSCIGRSVNFKLSKPPASVENQEPVVVKHGTSKMMPNFQFRR